MSIQHGRIKTASALILIMLIAVSLIPSAVYADAANGPAGVETVRLGYFNFQNYMLGAEEDAVKSGYVYDLLCDIAAINNWNYEFVYGDFNDLYVELLNGSIDILPCLVYTEERAQSHLFSDEEIYAEHYYISVLNDKAADFTDIRDLDGKRLSSVIDTHQNEAFNEWAEKNGISMELICTGSYDESWAQLKDGRADYILNIDSAAQDSGFTTLLEVGSGSSRFAIAPGREDLVRKMNSAVDIIYEINPFSIAHLKEKYLTDTLSSYILSDAELEWLQGRDSVRVAGFKDNMPYTYLDSSGNVAGVYPDALSAMFSKLGIGTDIEWTLYDSETDMQKALADGEAELICPAYPDHFYAQANDMIISETIQSIHMGLLYREKTDEKQIHTIAVPDSVLAVNYVNDIFLNAEIIRCGTVKECIESVASNIADAAVAQESALQQEADKKLKTFQLKTLASDCGVCFSTGRENGMLLCIVNRGLHLIDDSELQSYEILHAPDKDYSFRNYFKNNKLLVGTEILVLLLVIWYAAERSSFSRKLEKNLAEITKQKEIIELNEKELEEATLAANAANKAKSSFLLNMSHDIRTPMNAILGYASVARKNTEEPQTGEYLNKIEIAGKQLLSLVNQVLEMSRIESGKIVLQEQKINMDEGADMIRTVYADQAKARGLTMKVEVRDVTHRHAIGDNDRLSQVTNNLIGNAIKYTQEGGFITTYVEEESYPDPDYALYRLTVEDTGIGMSEDFLPHLFEEFTREETSTVSRIQGTGLGMPIVKKLVDLMGGTIEVTSKLGEGSKFVVRVPLKIDTEYSEEKENESDSKTASLDGLKILLVEDNEMNREIAVDILEEAGALIDTAEDGVIALKKVADSQPGRYDVILMDVQMPRMDGYEATRRIRQLDNKELSSVTIIAMTANAFAEDRQNALDAGMNDHLAKPIDVQLLLSKLSKLRYN